MTMSMKPWSNARPKRRPGAQAPAAEAGGLSGQPAGLPAWWFNRQRLQRTQCDFPEHAQSPSRPRSSKNGSSDARQRRQLSLQQPAAGGRAALCNQGARGGGAAPAGAAQGGERALRCRKHPRKAAPCSGAGAWQQAPCMQRRQRPHSRPGTTLRLCHTRCPPQVAAPAQQQAARSR